VLLFIKPLETVSK